MTDGFEERYGARLEQRGLTDVRPLYRKLLVRLKKRDEAAYEEGVRRYREEVEPALETADDPVLPWLRYGAWLARRLTPGELTAVGPDGAASEIELEATGARDAGGAGAGDGEGGAAGADEAPAGSEGAAGAGRDALGDDALASLPPGTLLLHLPEDDGEPGIPLAVPSDPSVHQEATRELLCG